MVPMELAAARVALVALAEVVVAVETPLALEVMVVFLFTTNY